MQEDHPSGLHNLVHGIVGGIMGNVRFSPSDPVFWLHYAYCDKIWWDWQKRHPSESPSLSGSDKILDSWNVSTDNLNDINNILYSYE